MRIAFMGTPDFAVSALDALHRVGHEIAAVYTQPPRPANRGRLTPSPVQLRAEALGLQVRTPERLKGEAEQAEFAALNLDCAVVAAYGLILPPQRLTTYRLVDLVFQQNRVPYTVALEVGGWEVIKQYVAMGQGISIVTAFCLTEADHQRPVPRGRPPAPGPRCRHLGGARGHAGLAT